jgi:hypothetical protein
MEISKKILLILTRYILIVFLVIITACQGGLFSYRGRIVEPDKRLALSEGGPHKGSWQTFDLMVDYQYEQKAGKLHLSGVAELSYHYKANYDNLDHFYLTVFFLDTEGKVLDSELVLNAISSDLDETFPFEKNLEIPSNSVSIAFHDMIGVREGNRDHPLNEIIP